MVLRRKLRKPKFTKQDWMIREQLEQKEEPSFKQEDLSSNLSDNESALKATFKDCSDVIFRSFLIGNFTKAVLIYTEGLANLEEIDKSVLTPLMLQETAKLTDIQAILEQKLTVSKVEEVTTLQSAIKNISSGNPVILIDHQSQGIAAGLAKWEKRSIEEPIAESVVRGPRDGFTETLGINISLLRRKIKSPDLKMKSLIVGRYSQTQIAYMYIEGIADKNLLEEVNNRLSRIDIDGVLESGYIEEFIEDYPFSPFPQILNTEPNSFESNPKCAFIKMTESRSSF